MAGKDTARLQGKFAVQVKPNRLAIVLAVGAACVIAALPFRNKTVWETEQKMAALRDGQTYKDPAEAKNEARNERLQGPRRQ